MLIHIILLFFAIIIAVTACLQFLSLVFQVKENKKIFHPLILMIHFVLFLYSCAQIGNFWSQDTYTYLYFPYSVISHIYLFFFPVLLFTMLTYSMYKESWKKRYYFYQVLAWTLAIIAYLTFPGKDLLWFSPMLSVTLILVGLKSKQYPLHYRNFLLYLFFENTWVCFFYFSKPSFYMLGLFLQVFARIYLYNLLSLYWVANLIDLWKLPKKMSAPHSEMLGSLLHPNVTTKDSES